MADKKIQMKIKNGDGWDNVYPRTKAELVEGLTEKVTELAGEVNNLPSASTSVKGIVLLSDVIDSVSTTEAATANAVKVTHDLAARKSKVVVSADEPTDADMWYQEI